LKTGLSYAYEAYLYKNSQDKNNQDTPQNILGFAQKPISLVFKIAGVDEVGRGCLAGPVVVAAVILDPDHLPQGLADSKKLSAKARAHILPTILETAKVGIGQCSAAEIDQSSIRLCTLLAMQRAVAALPLPPQHVLIDGRDRVDLPMPAEYIIKGDAKIASIAAASIVAKETRDSLMREYDALYPQYGFAQHMGYATAQHRAAIEKWGGCPLHRYSFVPLKTRI
jgi:ribonuclease HII